MKLKRIGALVLTLALTLSLTAVPAHAITFTDVPEDFWGYEDITKMSNLGYAKGYDDGSFKPNGRMTAAETLLFCARATGVDSVTQAKIAETRKEEMTHTLPTSNNMNVWAAAEMAVAVEAGVLSISELEELSQADPKTTGTAAGERTFLEETMSRENICKYLVRAMQLEPLARSLSNYSLSYADRSDVTPALQPYVYVLTNFGIVKGKDGGLFDPQGAVTRAEMTTMLNRALDFMKEQGIVTELSEYTDYDWKAGTISTVTNAADGSIILALASEISGTQSYSVPSTAKIYHDNMLTTSTALRAGQYARLNLNANGAVREVRLSGVMTTYSGTISDLTDNQLTVLINGASHTLTIDRFTEVSVGKTTGDCSIIDEDAGYTSAVCYVDEMGHLGAVRFSGGTQMMEGLVESVTTIGSTTTLGVAAFNGVIYHYTIPLGTTVTVNGVLGSLSTAHVGKYVQVRVNSDTSDTASVVVDTLTQYIQGPIRRQTTGNNKGITIADTFRDNKESTYVVSPSAPVTFNDEIRTVADIQVGWYATVLVSNGIVVQVDAYPGSVTVEGVLSSISYGPITTLQITQKDDSVVSYSLDLTNLPEINRSGKASSIDQLRTGDQMLVTVRYNEVERMDATPQTANLSGVITEKTETSNSVTIGVRLTDGTTTSYVLTGGVSVTQNNSPSNIYSLRVGHTIAMVTNGEQVVSIDITAAASSATELSGTVLTVNSSGNLRTMMVLVTDSLGTTSPVTIDVSSASLLSLKGNSLNLNGGFTTSDVIRAFGSYDDQGSFKATIVINQNK